MQTRTYRRLCGLLNVMDTVMVEERSSMNRHEVRLVAYLGKTLRGILKDMPTDGEHEIVQPNDPHCVRGSNQVLNTQCEFFDLNANRIQCALGCDMYHCTRGCRFATNMPGSLPPYGTKYMRGRL